MDTKTTEQNIKSEVLADFAKWTEGFTPFNKKVVATEWLEDINYHRENEVLRSNMSEYELEEMRIKELLSIVRNENSYAKSHYEGMKESYPIEEYEQHNQVLRFQDVVYIGSKRITRSDMYDYDQAIRTAKLLSKVHGWGCDVTGEELISELEQIFRSEEQ